MTHSRFAGLAFLGLLLTACGESTPPPAAASNTTTSTTTSTTATTTSGATAEETEEFSDGIRDHHRHHHGGVLHFISISLETLGVSPDQRAKIEKIQGDLKARMSASHDASRGLIGTLAEGVAAGNIDKAKVDAQLAQLGAAAGAAHDAAADALNQLHAVLDPSQRAALVDKVEANWQVWRDVNHEEKPGSMEDNDRLSDFAKEFTLTPDQTAKITAALQSAPETDRVDPAEMDNYVKTFRTAFAADSFDAKTLTTGNAASNHVARAGAARMARFYEAAVPVLTPDQRTKVAEGLRDHLNPSPSPTSTH